MTNINSEESQDSLQNSNYYISDQQNIILKYFIISKKRIFHKFFINYFVMINYYSNENTCFI